VRIHQFLKDMDWKRTYALTVVYGYMYDILFWPFAFWASTIITLRTGVQFPAPPLVPWEQLAVATANLAVIGTVQFLQDKRKNGSSSTVSEYTRTDSSSGV
jgi:hypothetical protein